MSQGGETFFTVVGCMDGRCQEVVSKFGHELFGGKYPDTITGPGIVGTLFENPTPKFLEDLKNKLLISIEKHHSQGIIVDGHAECAGDPVDDTTHKEHVKKAVAIINDLINNEVPVAGVFVKRNSQNEWEIEEVVKPTVKA